MRTDGWTDVTKVIVAFPNFANAPESVLKNFSRLTFEVSTKENGEHKLKKSVELHDTLWSSGQSFWLQIQRSRFRSRRYQIF